MAVVRLDLAYDGSGYHGFARQPGLRTVQGEIESALERILGARCETIGAGRTDAGVHARHQIVSFPAEEPPDLERLRRALDGLLGPEISVWAIALAPDSFSARFSPAWRAYRYHIDPRPSADPLARSWVWHVGKALDLDAMNLAARQLVGLHDFASFCRSRAGATTVREVLDAEWATDEAGIVFVVSARAFCHQMVRSLVGLCVDVGLGRVGADTVGEVIATRDRRAVGTVAPPHGLILWEVGLE